MRLSCLASTCVAVVLVALVVSCGGLVQHEGGCNDVARGSGASEFCDFDSGPPQGPMTGPFGPGPGGFDGGGSCSTLTSIVQGPANMCAPDDAPQHGNGEVCRFAEDCPSECCIADEEGMFRPVDERDASTGTDASTDGGADTDADMDASADAGARPLFASRRIRACDCGVCLRRDDACAIANSGRGLGGP